MGCRISNCGRDDPRLELPGYEPLLPIERCGGTFGAVRFQYPPLLTRPAGALDPPRDAPLLDGGVKGRYPPRSAEGADCVPRWGSMFLEPMFGDPIVLRSELPKVEERVLLLGGVNGRNPPLLLRGADCVVPRGDSTVLLGGLMVLRSEPPKFDCRLLLLGAGRNPPRFPF